MEGSTDIAPQTQRSPDRGSPWLQVGLSRGYQGHVTDLSLLRRGFPVEMEVCPLHRHYAVHGRNVSDDIEHYRIPAKRRGAQGQRQHSPKVILELAGLGPLNGPMARVVNPWCQLIGEQNAVG